MCLSLHEQQHLHTHTQKESLLICYAQKHECSHLWCLGLHESKWFAWKDSIIQWASDDDMIFMTKV
jgi:hypothetical protein